MLLLAGSTLITYIGALLIKCWRDRKGLKNITVAVSLVLNFGILFLFKYFDFAAVTLQKVLGKVGIAMQVPKLDILLPVGISFYIFSNSFCHYRACGCSVACVAGSAGGFCRIADAVAVRW